MGCSITPGSRTGAGSSAASRCGRGSPPAPPAIPEVHYGDDSHWVCGDRSVSEWTLTGTTAEGERLDVRGCDLWTFRAGKALRKDSYWKIVERTSP